ncbi:hypothetical protein OE88DRAFT_515564 [Heliocybe sulcata]|uniref:Uncharacterized protein n=1 Tax=Heliocybe sulcata TaxID=5364 RepID=A0A5C3MV05_9AGAM|nr:hypothetical protein OE88DRAFT_515564 [Heliocybe sulcata]
MTWKSELDTFWNTYRKEMASLGLGTALWQPSPPIDTNTGSYVYKQVEAGDVGFIHAGVFNRLFNIFLPEDHEWQQTFGVPHGFKPLKVPGRHHWTSAESFLKELAPLGGTLGPAPLHSESVKCHKVTLDVEGNSSIPIPAIQFKFSCTKQAGAALVLPHRAERYDTMRSKLMEKYMTDNWESWLDFTERLGMDVELQDLYLVTGCDRTDEWAMAAFRRSESEIAASATIIVPGAANVTAAFSCKWETTSSVLHNTGPYRPTSSTPTDDSSQRDKATLCNQTVFIRGYRMKKRKNWKGKQVAPVVIRASAGYDERDLGPGDDEGSAGCSSSTSSDEEDDTRQDIPDPKDVNLLDPVLDYILQSCPEADVAIAHDEDIYPYIMVSRGAAPHR